MLARGARRRPRRRLRRPRRRRLVRAGSTPQEALCTSAVCLKCSLITAVEKQLEAERRAQRTAFKL
eukprot:scaffold76082_cov35-Phaeocystis_antarctica.AAC.1